MGDLQNIFYCVALGAIFGAILRIFWLCRRIHNTMLVSQKITRTVSGFENTSGGRVHTTKKKVSMHVMS